MKFDLLGSIQLTASAAVAIAVVAFNLGSTTRDRIRLAAGLAVWFAAVVALVATGALGPTGALGVPGFGVAVLAPVVVLAFIGRAGRPLRRALDAAPLAPLIGLHALRILGVNFLLLHAAGRLPAPFAPLAGWGDIAAGLAAIPVAWLMRRHAQPARGLALAWNTFGLADLVTAIGLGVVSAPGPLHLIHAEPSTAPMTALPWVLIPAFLVPLLAATHLAVFHRILTAGAGSTNEASVAAGDPGRATEWRAA